MLAASCAAICVDRAVQRVPAVAHRGRAEIDSIDFEAFVSKLLAGKAVELALRVEQADGLLGFAEDCDHRQEQVARLAGACRGEDDGVFVGGVDEHLVAEKTHVEARCLRIAVVELVDGNCVELHRGADLLFRAKPARIAELVVARRCGLSVDDVVFRRLRTQGGIEDDADEPCQQQVSGDSGNAQPIHAKEALQALKA